jgi:hypothetical protein
LHVVLDVGVSLRETVNINYRKNATNGAISC